MNRIFQYGEKQELIQDAIRTELESRLPECGLSPLSISLNDLRLAVRARIPKEASLNRMEVLNAVLKDPKLSSEAVIGTHKGEPHLSFYSGEAKKVLEIIYAAMEKIVAKKRKLFPAAV